MAKEVFIRCPFCGEEISRRDEARRKITPGEAIKMHETAVRHIKREHGR